MSTPPVTYVYCIVSSKKLRSWRKGIWVGIVAAAFVVTPGADPITPVALLIPLIAYLVLRRWDGSLSRRAFLIWTSLAFAAEFYTFLEAFADLTLVAPLALVIGYLVAARDVRPKVARLAVDSAVAYVEL